tara:strand:- start:326 stop:580 length:255 start_codon:yes stop_codon:yes gene_type:complete
MFNKETAIIATCLSLIGLILAHISETVEPSIAAAAGIFWLMNAFGLVLNVVLTPFKPMQSLAAGFNWINLQILAFYCDGNGVVL